MMTIPERIKIYNELVTHMRKLWDEEEDINARSKIRECIVAIQKTIEELELKFEPNFTFRGYTITEVCQRILGGDYNLKAYFVHFLEELNKQATCGVCMCRRETAHKA